MCVGLVGALRERFDLLLEFGMNNRPRLQQTRKKLPAGGACVIDKF